MDTGEGKNLVSKPHTKQSSKAQTTPIAFSPRTTRRNMLAAEMTASARKELLFARQQTNAVLERRHTTQNQEHSWTHENSLGPLSDQTSW